MHLQLVQQPQQAADVAGEIVPHAIYRIANAAVRDYPFPHFYVEDLFPPDAYEVMLDRLPDRGGLPSVLDSGRVTTTTPKRAASYDCRRTIRLNSPESDCLEQDDRNFWNAIGSDLGRTAFVQTLLGKFAPALQQRYAADAGDVQLHPICDLVCDAANYSLGPHTDHPKKVAVLLIFLAHDDSAPSLGTSLYVPRQDDFNCAGGGHYDFADFHRVFTAVYRPNSALGFLKTANSFHGVEPIEDADIARDLILYDIRITNPSVLKSSEKEDEAPALVS